MKPPKTLFLLLLALALTACTQSTAAPSATAAPPTVTPTPEQTALPESDLTLNLKLGKDTYTLGESIRATLTIRYVGGSFAFVNIRLACNNSQLPSDMREVIFLVYDNDGELLREISPILIQPVLLQPYHFSMFGPNDAFERTYPDIHRYRALTEPGEYTIQAVYENYTDPGDGRTAWQGQVFSNIVSFTIEP